MYTAYGVMKMIINYKCTYMVMTYITITNIRIYLQGNYFLKK